MSQIVWSSCMIIFIVIIFVITIYQKVIQKTGHKLLRYFLLSIFGFVVFVNWLRICWSQHQGLFFVLFQWQDSVTVSLFVQSEKLVFTRSPVTSSILEEKISNFIWQVVQPAVQTCLKCNSLVCPTFCPQPRIWTLFNLVFEWTLFKPRENIQIFYLKPPQFWSIKLLKLQDLMEVQIWRHKMYGEIAAPTTKNIPPCYLSFLSRRPDSAPALVH